MARVRVGLGLGLKREVRRLGGEVEELLGRVVDEGESEPRHVEEELLLGDRLLLDVRVRVLGLGLGFGLGLGQS